MEATLRTLAPAAIVFLIAAMVTAVGAIALEMLREWRERRTLATRLRALDAAPTPGAGVAPELLRAREEVPPLIQFLSARIPRLADLAVMLEQGNVKWSVQTFLFLSLGLGVGLGLAFFVALGMLGPALAAAVAGAAAPFGYVRMRRKRRVNAFEEHFPDAIDLMGRALRAGHPLSAAVQMVADEMPDPVGTDFRRVFEEHKFGLAMNDVLLALADRVPLVDVRIFVTAVVIQREVGGNLAELLDKIAYTMRERFKIRRQIRVHTAQGRLTGYLLAALPVLTGIAFLILNPDYLLVLFRTSTGHFVVAVVLALQVIGFFWIRRVIDIEI